MIHEGPRCSFVAEYFDTQANLARTYLLLFYSADNSIEMYDVKNKRLFLKRCVYPQLTAKELYVGGSVTIYSRVLKLVDFGDEVTRRAFTEKQEEVMVIIHGEGIYRAGEVVQFFSNQEVRTINIRLAEFDDRIAKQLGTSSLRCFVAQLGGSNLESKAQLLRQRFPGIVSTFLEPADINLIRDLTFSGLHTTATMQNCAVCVIKPHAIGAGHAGTILQRILDEGFEVTAMGQFNLTLADSEDFLEVYKGVVTEYRKVVEHMASAPLWALEVRSDNAVAALRAVCGPHDPEVCNVLFPHTIRAAFGIDRVLNAVHCTDLLEDGPLESEFFFSLMASKK